MIKDINKDMNDKRYMFDESSDDDDEYWLTLFNENKWKLNELINLYK